MSSEPKKTNQKILILLRHAHRDLSDRSMDNGLSEQGWVQAKAISEEYLSQWGTAPSLLLSSKKLRCQETLEPLSEKIKTSVQIDPRLLEQEAGESYSEFYTRIEAFLLDWKNKGPTHVVACTHGDWLPVALEMLTGSAVDMKKGAWAEIRWDGQRTHLECLKQKL